MNVQEAMSSWDRTFGKSEKTKRAYTNGLRVFIGYLQKNNIGLNGSVDALRPELFIAYPAWLGTGKYTKKTRGVYLSGVRSFMNWLTIGGYLELTYSQSMRWKMATEESNKIRESRLPRFPKRDDAAKMIAGVRQMSGHRLEKLRNIALVLFLASSGCRNEEATKLVIHAIDLEKCTTTVIGKGNKERRIFFSRETSEAIRTYLSARGATFDQPLFIRHDKAVSKRIEKITTATVRDIVMEIANFAGVESFTPHWFRHALAIRLLEETGNLAMVQEILGHSDPATTRIYAQIYPEKLEESYRRIYG